MKSKKKKDNVFVQMANGHVEPPDPSEVLRLGIKACEEPLQSNECLPQLVEEYILQTERAQGRVYHIKLSLLQRPSTTEYFGELYVDRDFKEGQRNGASCRLGNCFKHKSLCYNIKNYILGLAQLHF